MKFDVYCDESRPETLALPAAAPGYLVIGGLWLHREDRKRLKEEIHALRDRHKIGGEFKWQKISPARIKFYEDIITLFFSEGDRIRFRCIAVERKKVDLLAWHQNDQELGFYKFYYQLLHHWILDFNEYAIFCDYKANRNPQRLKVLADCLRRANLSARITTTQALHSSESVLLQMADVLTGLASTKLNCSVESDSSKARLIAFLEAKLGRSVSATPKDEQKFNLFNINPGGGW